VGVAVGATVGGDVATVGDVGGVVVGDVVNDGHAAPMQSHESPVHPTAHPAV
jgi:hypothetical protein